MAAKTRAIRLRAIIGVACLLPIGYAFWLEPDWVDVTVHAVESKAATGDGPQAGTNANADAGPGAKKPDPIRIAQLSDLHLRDLGAREAAVAQAVRQMQPDLVVLSGDVIDRADTLAVLDGFLASLGGVRTVAVLGNWEHWSDVDLAALRALYETRHNGLLLVNQEALLRIRSRTLRVVGLDDFTAGKPALRLMKPVAAPAPGNGAPGGGARLPDTSILVQHSPGWFQQPEVQKQAGRFDLCLSGHTHGGQVALFGQPIWTPRGSGTFQHGTYRLRACTLYVSRGVGTSILPIRFGARPEVPVFEL